MIGYLFIMVVGLLVVNVITILELNELQKHVEILQNKIIEEDR